MAIIDDPTAFFQTTLYTGDGGGTRAVTNDGNSDLSPNWVWIKDRGTTSTHYIFDSVRGVQKHLTSAATTQELTDANSLKSFNSDGFTLGTSGNVNGNSRSFVSWNWKANGSGSLNEVGSIDSTVSVNTTSGFSICKWTGNATNSTIGHGLGAVPKMIMIKNLSNGSAQWVVYHVSTGNTQACYLNTTTTPVDVAGFFNDTTPTSSVFTLGTDTAANGSGNSMIAYCFSEVKGYSKFGVWAGNGNADGPFIYTGFKPAYVFIKAITVDNDFLVQDNKRYPFNTDVSKILYPNSAKVEADTADTDILSNGFKLRNTTTSSNTSGRSYIYMAIAENPFVTSTDNGSIPTTAR